MLPELYGKGKKGEIRSWKIYTEGADIVTEHGMLEGKIQVARKTAKAKNLGKKNETTPEEQAIAQAKSMWQKQIDKGYFDSIEKAKTTQVFRPMLASKFEDKKHNITYPCTIQPKLDGNRCLAYWEDGKVKLMSRGGKQYDIEHISKACEEFLGETQVFDGEIYIHGMPLQDINSLVRKSQEDSINLEYWVYDTFYKDNIFLPWIIRLQNLKMLYKQEGFESSPIKKVPYDKALWEEQVYEAEKAWVKKGYEGAILRDFNSKYELSKRSNYLLKVKSFLDEEFTITGYKEGEGKFLGCVIWECETSEDKRFHVTPKGTMEQRAEWFQRGNQYVGKLLTVKYFQKTKDNIPQFPVGLAIRLDEDL
ncbi:hypothetical protein N8Z24_00540 [bacterium]|nr:hypothetical protein [bacterium]